MAFGKKVVDGEIDLTGAPIEGAREFLRMWSGGQATCLVDAHALGADPALFGIALVDAARHGAKAWAQAVGVSESDAMARIWLGFDAERSQPTDQPRQIGVAH